MKALIADCTRAGTTTCMVFGALWFIGAGSSVQPNKWPLMAAVSAAAGQQQTSTQGVDTPMNPATDATFMQWAIREGGAFAVILVVLFFYRRDWKTAVEFWKDQHSITTDLVIKSTAAQIDCAASIRESNIVTHQLKRVLEREFPERRGADRQ